MAAGSASIGQHTRHSLNHFQAIASRASASVIDYDARERGTGIEHDSSAALAEIERLRSTFEEFRQSDLDEPVKVSCQVNSGPAPVVRSTLCRELMFVISHTIHHNALIRFILNSEKIATPAGFGIAPSTAAHHKQNTT